MGAGNCRPCCSNLNSNAEIVSAAQAVIPNLPRTTVQNPQQPTHKNPKQRLNKYLSTYEEEKGSLQKNIPNSIGNVIVKRSEVDMKQQQQMRLVTWDSDDEDKMVKPTESADDQISFSTNRKHLVEGSSQQLFFFENNVVNQRSPQGYKKQRSADHKCCVSEDEVFSSPLNHLPSLENINKQNIQNNNTPSNFYGKNFAGARNVQQVILYKDKYKKYNTGDESNDSANWVPFQMVDLKLRSSGLLNLVEWYLPNSPLLQIDQHRWSLTPAGNLVCGKISDAMTSSVVTCLLTDNHVYYGEVEGFIPNGLGVVITKQKTIFKGLFADGVAEGKGKLQDLLKGITVQGVWSQGVLKRGVRRSPLSEYEGNFNRKGQPSGKGFYRDAISGAFYQGTFQQGKFSGSGILGTQKSIYEGKFSRGKKHGEGRMQIFEGQHQGIIKGEWQEDRLVSIEE